MKAGRLAGVSSLLSLIGLASQAAAPPQPFTAQDLVDLKRVSEPAVSPDGRWVAFTVRETDLPANRGRTDLWLLDLATRGATPKRLTSHPENDSSATWSPDSRRIYFTSGRSGSNQVWQLSLAGGEAEPVTQLPLDVGSFKLSPDGTRIALTLDVFPDCANLACTVERLKTANEAMTTGHVHDRLFVRHWDTWKDGTQSHLYAATLVNDTVTGEPTPVSRRLDADVPSKPFGDATEYSFTPDGTRLVFSARIKGRSEAWSTNFDLYEAAVDGSTEPVNLTADNPAWDTQPVFSPDGSLMAWRAMERAGFEADRFQVKLRNLKTGEQRPLTAAWDRSVDAIAFSHDGKTLYATTDHFGQHPLWSIEVKSGKAAMLTGPGHVDSFSVGKDQVVLAIASLKSPAELYRLAGAGDARRITEVNTQLLASRRMGEPEQFTFAGANGDTVYAYVMKPANFDAQRKHPVAFIVHGGPQVSFANAWSYRWNPQTYAGAGYATVFVDFHGSPGYGQAFTDSISGDWGGKPLEDLKAGLAAALAQYSWLDSERVCALGASYGGYMINWIAGVWSEPFRCLVSHAGIFDSRFMAYSTEELWFDEWEHGGTPFDVPGHYEKHNPVNHVAGWRVPMMVIHGQRDYRVPYSQGIAGFTALQRRGIASRLLVFPDENHWVLKPANSLQWHSEVERWLGEWLGR